MAAAPATVPSVEKVIATPELLENILLHVDDRVNTNFCDTITNSIALKRFLWLAPLKSPPPETEINPIFAMALTLGKKPADKKPPLAVEFAEPRMIVVCQKRSPLEIESASWKKMIVAITGLGRSVEVSTYPRWTQPELAYVVGKSRPFVGEELSVKECWERLKMKLKENTKWMW